MLEDVIRVLWEEEGDFLLPRSGLHKLGEFQLRSVGPLPATITTAGKGPGPKGLTIVPYTVVSPNCQSTSKLSPYEC